MLKRKGRWFVAAATATAAGVAVVSSASSAAPEAPALAPVTINASVVHSTDELGPHAIGDSSQFRSADQYAAFKGPQVVDPPTRLVKAALADASTVRAIPTPTGINSKLWIAQSSDGPCVLALNANGSGGVACTSPQSETPPALSISGPDPGINGTLVAGVVPDGITAVSETTTAGTIFKIPVAGNGYVAVIPGDAGKLAGVTVPGFPSEVK